MLFSKEGGGHCAVIVRNKFTFVSGRDMLLATVLPTKLKEEPSVAGEYPKNLFKKFAGRSGRGG
jgi:hypothetical protein